MERPDASRRDEELETLLRAVDHEAPRVRANALIERARRRAMRRSIAVAATALVTVAGVAAAATPGSPLRRFVASLVPAHGSTVPSSTSPRAGRAPAPPGPRGVAFIPGTSVVVAFRDTQPAGVLRVHVVDEPALRLSPDRAVRGYAFDAEGVTVDNAGSQASFDLRLPRGVRHGRITVGSRTVFTKDGALVKGAAPADAHGDYVIPLGGAGRAP